MGKGTSAKSRNFSRRKPPLSKQAALNCPLLLVHHYSIGCILFSALFCTRIYWNTSGKLCKDYAFHAFIMMFSSFIPTPNGSGAAEYSFSLLFGSLMGQEMLLLSLLLWRLLTSYSCILFGGIAMFVKTVQRD